ncbi:MAG: SDR family NAD(P)-dependent oxidoreductase [Actinobacteria bacterium]|nr:SDR family NAD(P)-dependent oxidoreductase [Actinomycetota bacterium]
MRNVLITGAASGIGRATVAAFAAAGDRVVAGVRRPGSAPDVAGATVVELDVCDDDSVERAVVENGPFDVVVNNAGISRSGPVETIDWDVARAQFETNYWGALRVIRAALPAMRERRNGLVVNLSTVGARTPARGYHAFYQGSKQALQAASQALAWEVEPFGIRVVLIEPGFVSTNIFEAGGYGEAPPVSPYAADEAWVRRFFVEGAAAVGIPSDHVARAIVDLASQSGALDLHQPVGDDARAGIEAAQALTFEAWRAGAQSRIAALVGERPSTPA